MTEAENKKYNEKLGALQAAIDKGFASGIGKRTIDEIFADVRARR